MRFLFFLLLIGSSFAVVSLRVGGKDSRFYEAVVERQLHGRFLIRNLTLTFHNPGSRVAKGGWVLQRSGDFLSIRCNNAGPRGHMT